MTTKKPVSRAELCKASSPCSLQGWLPGCSPFGLLPCTLPRSRSLGSFSGPFGPENNSCPFELDPILYICTRHIFFCFEKDLERFSMGLIQMLVEQQNLIVRGSVHRASRGNFGFFPGYFMGVWTHLHKEFLRFLFVWSQ